MKTKARIALLLILLVLIAAGLACIGGGDGDVTKEDAQATYGAEQFHIQLTEQAKP